MPQAVTSSRAAAGRRLGLPAGGWALLAGVMLTTALPPFRGTAPLALPALAILFAALLAAEHPARTAWLFGLAHGATLLHWLFQLVGAAPIASRSLVAPMAIATVLYVSIFYLAFGWVVGRVRLWRGPAAALLLAPVAWTGMEWLRAFGELGFPWCLSGTAWLASPLLPLVAAVGELGLSAGTSFTAAAFVAAALAWRGDVAAKRCLLPALAIAAALVWGGLAAGAAWRPAGTSPEAGRASPVRPADTAAAAALVAEPSALPPTPPGRLRVAAAQADVSLEDKWQRARIDSTIQPYTALTDLAGRLDVGLVVWAETAIPSYLLYEPDLLNWVRSLADRNDVHLYAGFPDARLDAGGQTLRYNSSGLFDPDGALGDRYAKHHLLPIGERMPFSRYLPFLARIDLGQAEWAAGERPAPIMVPLDGGEVGFAGLICYEAIFGDLARGAVRAGARLLVNITNDGWFGTSAGPKQHAALARLRAVECGVPLVRCANNGISYVTGADGHPVALAGLGERALVVADIAPGAADTLYVRLGAWPLAVFCVLWVVAALAIAPRPRGPEVA